MAFLELHDNTDEPLVARCPSAGQKLVYDYDYQIEVYIDQMLDNFRTAPGLVCVKMFGGKTPEEKTHTSPLVATWNIENGRRGERTLSPLPEGFRAIGIMFGDVLPTSVDET